MAAKRRKHSGSFKSKVALEAIRGVRTVNEIGAAHNVHPVQVSNWKKELLERVPELFEKPKKSDEALTRRKEERLERKVGQLSIEVDWLKKKCDELGIPLNDEPW